MVIDPADVVRFLLEAGSAIGAGKWVIGRLNRMEREAKEARESSEKDCRESNRGLIARLTDIENRSHAEDRQDRAAMLRILENSASALSQVAEKLPPKSP